MRTIEIKLYEYDELSEDSQRTALDQLFDLNVDHEWWDCTYDDAATIGLKIESFDMYTAKGYLMYDPAKVKDLVKTYHGKQCGTYEYVNSFDMRTNIDHHEFTLGLLEEYRSMLSQEYEYQTSREQIEEGIRANGYEFTEDGKIS